MKYKYSKPVVSIEALTKNDILCASENAYVGYGDIGGGNDMMNQILSGDIWKD